MSKSAIARARYFANRKARRDQQNVFNKQNGLRPVSLKTMKKIEPPAPKPKIVKVVETKQIEIASAIVEKHEAKVEKQVLRAASKQVKKAAKVKIKKTPFVYPKKVKITLNKVVAKKKAAPAKKAAPVAKKIVKVVAKKTIKKVVAMAKKKAAPKKIVKVAKKVTKNKKK